MHLLNVRTGARYVMNQESPRVSISVNDPTALWVYDHHEDGTTAENGYSMISVLQKVGEVGGLPLYDNQVIAVSGRRPLFVPISREAYIRGIIHTYLAKAALNENDKPASDFMGGLLRKELAAMSAEQRSSDAYTSIDSHMTSLLVEPEAHGATPMFMFNPDYFDNTLPRSAVQLIVVRTTEPTEDPGPLDSTIFGVRSLAVWDLRNTIDYSKLKAMLDPRVR